MNPTAARRAIYGKLAGDSTLNGLLGSPASGFSQNIYYQEAPAGAHTPFVIFSRLAGTPTYTNVSTPALETDVWAVKAVDQNTTADRAEAISMRIDDLLTDGSLSLSGGTALYLRRESDIDYPETVDGKLFRHSGSQYRLVVEPS